ncbi:hypothetical protein GLW08_06390 [Pontibacillus yanchengensis]|uniref:Uncharacterized protein n=2 Tax=Pontibacillus yanchengensis TaxID=462910 RepID=A0ACC7VFH1_9BACI|nr:hypothetical protein [Pontibacillus yanchengensis]MYL32386.1 hypothetical protein [Pontibacillus yanchengensis]MYL52966.1 hypothetical protein [Pontibacillus yanchengensis]
MFVCPLCNGLQTIVVHCPACNWEMKEQGRVVDYLDDYSPYLDDEGLKLVDGDQNSSEEHECVHLYQCTKCDRDRHVSINELHR